MKICHVCSKECEDTIELCPVCGAVLNRNEPEAEPVKEITNPTLLCSFEDFISAEIFKDILSDNKILFAEEGTDGALRVTFGGGFDATDIYVDDADFEKATELYEEFLKSEEENNTEFFADEEIEEN